LIGQVSQLIDLGLVLFVLVSLVGLVQVIAGFFGFQRRDLAGLRVGLQAGVVGASLFQVRVGGVEQAASATLAASRAGIINCLRMVVSSF